MKHVVASILVLSVIFLAACGTPAASSSPAQEHATLTVFAAASLTDAFNEIGKAFQAAHPGATIKFNFAGSQTLRTQIEQGAPADVFASADMSNMTTLESEKLAGASQVFIKNQLVVILPPNNPANIASLQDLSKPGLKLVLAASVVPAGKYTLLSLDQMNTAFGSDFKTRVLANVVSNEQDVKEVVAKVNLGEADAGIVYVSDAVAAPNLKSIAIPAALNEIAQYPIAALNNSTNKNLAEAFIAFVLSADGQAILKKWGFTPIQ
jgi:molybdate transport system substrate-binding protein